MVTGENKKMKERQTTILEFFKEKERQTKIGEFIDED